MLPTLSSCCFYAEDLCALEVPVFYNLYLLHYDFFFEKIKHKKGLIECTSGFISFFFINIPINS